MQVVYLLQHSYELENGQEESKILGVFSDHQCAQLAINNYLELPGFKGRKDHFVIDAYVLDKEYWQEGFSP